MTLRARVAVREETPPSGAPAPVLATEPPSDPLVQEVTLLPLVIPEETMVRLRAMANVRQMSPGALLGEALEAYLNASHGGR